MKLKNKEILRAYIERCLINIESDYKNEFIGAIIAPETKNDIMLQMKEAGFHEFQGDVSTFPELYLSVDAFKERPYFKNIAYDTIQDGRISYTQHTIHADQLFNVEAIVKDPHREMNDSMVLRALDKDFEANALTIDGETWMLDIYSEAFTIDPIAEKAHGNVVTLGLGMGYFVYMASLNPAVTSITVIEKDPIIIDLFKTHILPQFPKTVSIKIIQQDAFHWFNKKNIDAADFVFVDIYQSSDDGYEIMETMLQSTLPPFEKVHFWIEDSCTEVIRSLIVLVFDLILSGQPVRHLDPYYNRLMLKIKKYLDANPIIIDSETVIKELIYDSSVLRHIMSTPIN